MSTPRLLAYYLPQFHPFPENDEWWGKGFTEWTNTAKARPRFPGHYQPHVPADLGFYDLRVPEVREAQADLARSYGIEGFCYYHYWFGNGRQLMQRPLAEVVASGRPDFPFCICWANDTWTGIWHGAADRILIEQQYPGARDDAEHFESLLPAFRDHRYITVKGKPVFLVWRPFGSPEPQVMVRRWKDMARAAGFPDLFMVGIYRCSSGNPEDIGYDASIHNDAPPLRPWGTWANPAFLLYSRIMRNLGVPTVWNYDDALEYFLPQSLPYGRYPSVIHAWDNTPRSGGSGLVFRGATPARFKGALRRAFALTRGYPEGQRFIFLKSWNEWAEGNHLEPDLRDGHAYLEALRAELAAETDATPARTRPADGPTRPPDP